MKKNITKYLLIAIFISVSLFNINSKKMKHFENYSALTNVEVLAEAEGVSDCNIYKYNRENKESYTYVKITQDIHVNGFVAGAAKLGAGATIGWFFKYPECVESKPNCCIKTWINGKSEVIETKPANS